MLLSSDMICCCSVFSCFLSISSHQNDHTLSLGLGSVHHGATGTYNSSWHVVNALKMLNN